MEEQWAEWSKLWDPSSETYYYYNNSTSATSWDKPEGFKEGGLYPPHLRATLRIQSVFRAKGARKRVRDQRGIVACKTNNLEEWIILKDPLSGYEYYYNTKTGGSTWDKCDTTFASESPEPDSKAKDTFEVQWLQLWDSKSSKYYYYNQETGESRWDAPEGYSKEKSKMSADIKATLLIQSVFRAKRARRAIREQRGMLQAKGAPESNGWMKVHDPSSGADYYYNTETGESKWEIDDKPSDEKESLVEWLKLWDSSSERFYYFNQLSGESQWDVPENFLEMKSHKMRDDLKATLLIQNVFRAKRARRAIREQRGKAMMEKEPLDDKNIDAVWIELKDPQSGYDYYFNCKTGESKWELDQEETCEVKLNSKKDEMQLPPEENKERNEIVSEFLVNQNKRIHAAHNCYTVNLARLTRLEDLSLDSCARVNSQLLCDAKASVIVLAQDTSDWHLMATRLMDKLDSKSESIKTEIADNVDRVVASSYEFETSLLHLLKTYYSYFETLLQQSNYAFSAIAKVLNENISWKVTFFAEIDKCNEFVKLASDAVSKCNHLHREANKDNFIERFTVDPNGIPGKNNEQSDESNATLYWQATLDALLLCNNATQQISKVESKLKVRQDLAAKESKQRQQFAEEANRKADVERRNGLAYEVECRQAFVEMCHRAWRKGVTMRNFKEELVDLQVKTADITPVIDAACFIDKQTIHSPWDACQIAVPLEDFIICLQKAKERRLYQEKKSFIIDAPDSVSGRILLHTAVWQNRGDIVKYLLSIGANPNAFRSTTDRATSLHMAVRGGFHEIVLLLLNSGADILAEDSNGDTALHWACRVESLSCTRCILGFSQQKQLDGDTYWKLLSALNFKHKTPTELIPRDKNGARTYNGSNIYSTLRTLEIEAQQRLFDAEVGFDTRRKSLDQKKNQTLNPIK